MDHTINLSLILSYQYVNLVVWLLRPFGIYLMVVGKPGIGQKDLQHSHREVTGYDRLGSSFRCNSLLVIHNQMMASISCPNRALGSRAEDKVISPDDLEKVIECSIKLCCRIIQNQEGSTPLP